MKESKLSIIRVSMCPAREGGRAEGGDADYCSCLCNSMFDHYAHLGGAAFGVFYYYYGAQIWNGLRRRYAS